MRAGKLRIRDILTPARGGVGLMDLVLLAAALLMVATDQTILFFHAIFVLLTVGAFFWKPSAFAWRAVFWVSVITGWVTFLAVRGDIPFEELLEMPLLSTILVVVFMIAWRRAQAQAKLLEQDQAFLQAVLENMEDAVIACDAGGRLAFSNSAARLFHGLPAGNLPLERWTKYYRLYTPENDAPAEERDVPIFRALRGERIENEEVILEPEHGDRRVLLVSGNRMASAAGDLIGAVIVMRDITERKVAEQRLQEVQEDERERIARDLHDTVLQDLSYALQKLHSPGEGSQKSVRGALQRALQGLRNSIYDLRPKDFQDLPLTRQIESLVRLNSELSPDLEIDLSVEEGFPEDLSRPAETELVRIIQEALANARRHSAASRVRVSLRSEEAQLILEVTDDGKGFQTGGARSGLGLRVMRERAHRLGGEVVVRSEPGSGTTVRLSVPRARFSGAVSEPSSSRARI